jgi:uncharacterized protein (DUF1697 family)
MAELRKVVESLGHTDVATFIASGNVIFSSSKAVSSGSLETAVEKAFGINVAVMLRTAGDLARIVKGVPFGDADPSFLHVGFMQRKPAAAAVKELDHERWLPEQFRYKGSELYLHLPKGMGTSKLPAYLDRQVKIPTTVRNWKTVTKLLELVAG